jgi:2-oxoacid dehydrogenases acyltransferase (catalytic domain)
MRAGRGKMPMYGLVDADVTTANRLLAEHDPPWSLTAFVVASVARAAAAHPEVHAYHNWRGQLVTHRHVDVGTMVEIATPQGPFALPHLLRDADIRGVPDLTAKLHRVKRDPSASTSGKWLEWAGPTATRIPGVIPGMYALMARSVAARQRIGTVAVTAVGMFAGGGGFGITSLSLMSLEVIVGGVSQRPRVIDGQVAVRDVLDLTVAIDHNVVDCAPAARFAAEFRELLESAAAISPSRVALQAQGDQQAGSVSGRGRFAARLRRDLVRLAGVQATRPLAGGPLAFAPGLLARCCA